MEGEAKKFIMAIGLSLVLCFSFLSSENHRQHSAVVRGLGDEKVPVDGEIDWWFDPVSKAVCWDGRTFYWHTLQFDFDGERRTTMTSDYSEEPQFLVVPMARAGNTYSSIGGIKGYLALLSETDVNPPISHTQFGNLVEGLLTEWFHVFVTKKDPPTDWVIGLQRSDGSHIIPLTEPFWYSEDEGKTWTEFDPLTDRKGNRTCREDFFRIEAEIDIDPDVLNPRSKGKWITAYVELPEGFDAREINASSVLLNGVVPPVLNEKYGFASDESGYITDHDNDGIEERMLKFSRSQVISILEAGDAKIVLSGRMKDGRDFQGEDEIKVLEG